MKMPKGVKIFAILVSSLLVAKPLNAQATLTWDGGGTDNNWSTATNWAGDVAPVEFDSLIFAGSLRLTNLNDFVAGTQFNGITFASGASAFTLDGNAINLGGDVVNLGTATQILAANLNLNLLGDTVFNTASGDITVRGGISGSYGLIKDGASQLTIANATTMNTYTGATRVLRGTLDLNFTNVTDPSASNLISSSSALELGGGTVGVANLTAASRSGSNNTQTFANTVIKAGQNNITLRRLGTTGSMTLNLGAITHETGGLLNVAAGTNGTLGSTVHVQTSTDNTNGILGGWATVGNDYAMVAGGEIVAFADYAELTDLGGNAYTITSDPTANLRIDSSSTYSVIHDAYTSGTVEIWGPANNPTWFAPGDSITGTGIRAGTWVNDAINDEWASIAELPNGYATTAAGDANTLIGARPINLAAGVTEVNTIQITDGSNRIINIGDGNTLRLGEFGGIWRTSTNTTNRVTITGGTLTAGGADDTDGEIVFNVAGTGGNENIPSFGIIVQSQITDNGLGQVSLTKGGLQTLRLENGNNSYSGGTYVNQGRLLATTGGALGTGDVYVTATAQLMLVSGVYTNNLYLVGSGPSTHYNYPANSGLNGNWGALVLNNGANVSGTVTLLGDTRITAAQAYSPEAYGSALTLNGTISGRITGNYALELGQPGNSSPGGTITISNSDNDWTGGLTISGGGSSGTRTTTVVLGASEVIPHGEGYGDLNLNKQSTSGAVTLNLNGFSETVNGLNSVGAGTGTQQILNNAANTVSTFTVGAGNANGAYGGTIINGAGIVELVKIGSGTQILSGANTFTGGATIHGGAIQLNNANAIQNSAVTINSNNGLTFGTGVGTFTIGGLNGNSNLVLEDLSATAITLQVGSGNPDASYGGILNGGGSLVKIGTGTQVLSGTNTYTGGTTLNAGVLSVSSNANLGSASGALTFNGGTLQATSSFTSNRATTLSAGGGTFEVTAGQTLEHQGVIGGAGNLTKTGAGNLTLTGSNNYTGNTVVNAGVLDLGGGGSTGSINSASTLVLGGGTFSLSRNDGFTQTFNGLTLNAGESNISAATGNTISLGAITVNPGGSVNFVSGGGTYTTTNSNVNGILGTWATYGGTDWATNLGGGVIGAFTGYTLTSLAGTNAANYTNAHMDVDSSEGTLSGVIDVQSFRFNLNTAPYTVTLTGTTNRIGGILVTSNVGNNLSTITGGTLTASTAGGNLVINQNNTSNDLLIASIIGNHTDPSRLIKNSAGTLILTATNTYTGGTIINEGAIQVGNGGTVGTIPTTNGILNNATLIFNRSNDYNLGAVISGAGQVIKNGAGLLRYDATSTYTGPTTINAGTLQIGNNSSAGAYTGGGTFTINSGGILAINRSNATSFNGVIAGVGAFNKLGAGVATLTGNSNSYTGTTTISAGTLTLGSGGTTGSLGTGNIVNNAALVVNRSNSYTMSNNISGTGSLTKQGTGVLTLTGTNTYSGTTTVSVGTLVIDGSLGNTAVTVASGARLGGSGDFGGAVTLQSGSTHAPGSSPGLPEFSAGLSYLTGSTFEFELIADTTFGRGINFDGVDVTGGLLTIESGVVFNISLNGLGSNVNFASAFWQSDRSWLIFDSTLAPSVTSNIFTLGSVSADSLGNSFASTGGVFSFSQVGNDIYLEYAAIPEPSASVLLGLGLAALWGLQKRGKKRFMA